MNIGHDRSVYSAQTTSLPTQRSHRESGNTAEIVQNFDDTNFDDESEKFSMLIN